MTEEKLAIFKVVLENKIKELLEKKEQLKEAQRLEKNL